MLTAPDLYADRLEQEFLRLLFKIPHAAPDEVVALIRSAMASELDQDYHSRTVLEHVTKSMECQPLCARFPDLVTAVAEKTWRLRPQDEGHYRSHRDLDELFGFEHSVHFHYFPESALQGPFPFLFASHPDIAVDFIVRLANQAALSYSRSEMGHEAHNVQLPTDTGSRPLIASPRLWALYRNMMPGPNVLVCALMSLESWLLSQAKQGNDIREVFRKILDSSTSAATVAVLASVAAAYPSSVEEKVLPLLAVQEFYLWDFQRSHQEHLHVTDMRSKLGIPTGGIEDIHYRERKESSALPHRKSNLEGLAFRLQWTSLRDRIWSILDQFYMSLPPEEKQSEANKLWRIALHRMDARHFKAEEGKEPGQVILTPGEPAPDLRQYIVNEEEKMAPIQRRMRLETWAMTRFRREVQSPDAFPDWHDALHEARALWEQRPSDPDENSLGMSGPCFVAAYLIRDHYSDLNPSEMEWCRQLVIREILHKDAERTFEARISRSSFDGSRPCALVLPLLLKGPGPNPNRRQVEECLAIAVTHTSEEVRDYAAEGVRSWLWEIDSDLARACVGGLCELANVENRIRRAERKLKKFSREGEENAVFNATIKIRGRIVRRETFTALNSPVIDLETHDWPELLDALSMIQPGTGDQDLRTFIMGCLAAVLRDAEAAEALKSSHRRQAHYEFQYDFARLFARFALARPVAEALRIGQFLRDYIEKCSKYMAVLLEELPLELDRIHSGEGFWTIWRSISGPIFEHPLLQGSTRIWRYSEMRKLVRVLLFADIKWKQGVKEWAPLSANRDFIEFAASVVGSTPAGFGALLSLLSSVGQVFLPDAIKLFADAVKRANGRDLLDDLNAAFDLEVVLRKVCYGFATDIRKRPELHRAVILLLDKLVERGSNTGFRLRDYIVAPLQADK